MECTPMIMRGILRTIRPLGDRDHKYRQSISPDLSSHNCRVRQIRPAGLSVDLSNGKMTSASSAMESRSRPLRQSSFCNPVPIPWTSMKCLMWRRGAI
jgi:hypothetical protein